MKRVAYKQIYIKDVDIPLFEEAERYGDSLSRVISEALKDFVEKKRRELDEEGFGEIEISVGRFPSQIEVKKFIGKKLATCKERLYAYEHEGLHDELEALVEDGWVVGESRSNEDVEANWTVFATKKGKYVVWRKAVISECDGFNNYPQVTVGDYWIIDAIPGKEKQYKVMLDEKNEAPTALFERAVRAEKTIKEEWLDL